MKVDVSEIKAFRNCKRQWGFNSRNRWHLTSRAPAPALSFGTLFHECLHSLYLGGAPEKVFELVNRELKDPAELRTMTAMLKGYIDGPLQEDINNYHIINIEYQFSIPTNIVVPVRDTNGFVETNIQTGEVLTDRVYFCGSIDMIAIDKETLELWGFEHKTAKSLRSEMFAWMDEQPRMYYNALKYLVEVLNTSGQTVMKLPQEILDRLSQGELISLGGVYINEVKKVQRTFEYQRIPCAYSEVEQERFLKSILECCSSIVYHTDNSEDLPEPEPAQVKCSMCQFSNICQHFGYNKLQLDQVLAEFGEEVEVRSTDHLEEKETRVV